MLLPNLCCQPFFAKQEVLQTLLPVMPEFQQDQEGSVVYWPACRTRRLLTRGQLQISVCRPNPLRYFFCRPRKPKIAIRRLIHSADRAHDQASSLCHAVVVHTTNPPFIFRNWHTNVEESLSGQQDVFRHHPDYIFRVVVLLEERTVTRQSAIEIRKCRGPHFLFPQKF
jgi:hypothetical protein